MKMARKQPKTTVVYSLRKGTPLGANVSVLPMGKRVILGMWNGRDKCVIEILSATEAQRLATALLLAAVDGDLSRAHHPLAVQLVIGDAPKKPQRKKSK
jgi:hypothetical protein